MDKDRVKYVVAIYLLNLEEDISWENRLQQMTAGTV